MSQKQYRCIDRILTKYLKQTNLCSDMGGQFDVNLSNYNMHTPTNDIDNIFLSNTVHKAIIGIIIA